MEGVDQADFDILVDLETAALNRCTAEQRAENMKLIGEAYADETKMAAEIEKMNQTFKAADTDGDGLLNEAEWLDFTRKTEANAKADGYHLVDTPEEDIKKSWETYCRICGKGGVDQETMMKVGEKVMEKAMEAVGG